MLSTAVLAACDEPDRIALEEAIAQGKAALAAGEVMAARRSYWRATVIDPGAKAPLLALGNLAEEESNPGLALLHYRRATYAKHPGAAPFLNLARIYAERGDLDRALRFVIAAFRYEPENPAVLALKAEMLARLGLAGTAIANAEAAVAAAPTDVAATRVRVGLEVAANGPAAGLQLLRLQPARTAPEMVALAIDLHDRLGEPEEAIDHLRSKVAVWRAALLSAPVDAAIDPPDDDASLAQREALVVDLAERLLHRGRPAEAMEVLRRWLRAAPVATRAANRLVDMALATGGLPTAEAELAGVFAAKPIPETPAPGLFAASTDAAEEAAARRAVLYALCRARLLILAGRTAEAATLIEDPETTAALPEVSTDQLLAMAAHWSAAGAEGRALSTLTMAALDRPFEGRVAAALVAEAIRQAEAPSALAALDAAVVRANAAYAPPETLVALSTLQAATGNREAARRSLETALQRSAEDEATLAASTRLEVATGRSAAARRRIATLWRERSASAGLAELHGGALLAAGSVQAATSVVETIATDTRRRGVRMPLAALAVDIALHGVGERPGDRIAALDRLVADTASAPQPAVIAEAALRTLALIGRDIDATAIAAAARIAATARAEAPGADTGWRLAAALAPDPAGALQILDAGMQRVSMTTALREHRALVLEAMGEIEAAYDERVLLFAITPTSARKVNNMVSLAMERGPLSAEEIEHLAALAARLRGSNAPEYLDTLGWLAVRRGDTLAGLGLLERAATGLPGVPLVLYHLGVAQMLAGQVDDAAATMRQALSLDSHNVFRYHAYAERVLNGRLHDPELLFQTR
ncbi:MAG: hypothetical protein AAF899_00860 [Pseudomonadota bacterium]